MTRSLLFFYCALELFASSGLGGNTDSIPSIKIGEQVWTTQNLNTVVFQNGDSILYAQSKEEWNAAMDSGTPAWCWFEKNGVLLKEQGIIYNYYAIVDKRLLAPVGWSVPSSEDFLQLHGFLETTSDPCFVLRDSSAWPVSTDNYVPVGFNACPAGYRSEYSFTHYNALVKFWTNTERSSDHPIGVMFYYNIDRFGGCGLHREMASLGAYVRCIRVE